MSEPGDRSLPRHAAAGAEAQNPFATARTRPGALAFISEHGDIPAEVVAKLKQHHWRGQIIGPHGSGKSTLLESIERLLAPTDRVILRVTLHEGERRLPAEAIRADQFSPQTLLIVDGYEQLSWWSRWKLSRQIRRRQAGLLITAHADVGWPTLHVMQPSLALTQTLAAQLMRDRPGAAITADDIAACYQRCEGNVRETLFALYDLYEQQRKN